MRTVGRGARLLVGCGLLASLILIPAVASGTAEDGHDTVPAAGEVDESLDPERAALLATGASVYSSVCQACHQPGGLGTEGVFPPLLDNPNVQDSAYVQDVILNGRSGELVVNGITYNNAMPAFALSSDEVGAVVAYVQAGLPDVAETAGTASAPVAGTAARELPGFSGPLALLAYLVVAAAFLSVLGPQIASRASGAAVTWPTAWLKAGAIVVFFVVATVVLPSWLMELGPVARAPRAIQDLIGSGVWATFLAGGLYVLWWAKRERRI